MTTIQQAIAEGRNHLANTIDNAGNEALILLQHASNKSKEFLIAHSDESIDAEIYQRYQQHIQRRLAGEPIAYITQEKEFWSLPLSVEPGVLIPRPETELLVETALELCTKDRPIHILDLGTGSGCIALALAKELPLAHIVACDNSEKCIQLAQLNADTNNIENVEFILSDWFEKIPRNDFDFIVSNPPYISQHDCEVELEVKQYEPTSALFSNNHGLADLCHIIQHAPQHLITGGTLIVEHGYQQATAVHDYLDKHQYINISTYTDMQQHERVTTGMTH